jgi:hypothetical protein
MEKESAMTNHTHRYTYLKHGNSAATVHRDGATAPVGLMTRAAADQWRAVRLDAAGVRRPREVHVETGEFDAFKAVVAADLAC